MLLMLASKGTTVKIASLPTVLHHLCPFLSGVLRTQDNTNVSFVSTVASKQSEHLGCGLKKKKKRCGYGTEAYW